MMNSIKKTLVMGLVSLVTFVFAEDTVENSTVDFSVQMSTDIAVEDSVSFSAPYTGAMVKGDNWEISLNYDENSDMFNVEEAKYSFNANDHVNMPVNITMGRQAIPYGIAWGLHRPADNAFISNPREDHTVSNGVSVNSTIYGAGLNFFMGSDDFWSARASYSLDLDNASVSVGYSSSSDSTHSDLVDLSTKFSFAGIEKTFSTEYNMDSETLWARATVKPEWLFGLSVLVSATDNGIDDVEYSYGLGYSPTDNIYLKTELDSDTKLIQVVCKF
tara:strand:+ start:4021 stop:4842 length:822 start_codon:yes stop_codon:yes gene_type:complete